MSAAQIWTIAVVLGIGTFVLRFSFLGLLGHRRLPDWLQSALRYTPVAIMPGLIAPAVFLPDQTGALNPLHLAAAAATLAVGVWTKSALYAILAGIVTAGLGVVLGYS